MNVMVLNISADFYLNKVCSLFWIVDFCLFGIFGFDSYFYSENCNSLSLNKIAVHIKYG